MAYDSYENIALKFDTKVEILINKLNKINANLHIDVSKYLIQIKDIEDRCKLTDENSSFGSGNAAMKMCLEGMFAIGLKELDKIEKIVENYEGYYHAYMCAIEIENKLNINISDEELNGFVSVCKKLIQLKSSPVEDYKTIAFVIDKIYEVSYEVMKYEMLINGDSSLYDYIKNCDNDVDRISNLVDKDLRKCESNKLYNDDVLKELITAIAIRENPKYITYLQTRIEEIDRELSKKTAIYNSEEEKLRSNLQNEKDKLSYIKTRILSVIVSLGIIITGFSLAKDSNKKRYEIVTSTSYKAYYDTYDSSKDVLTSQDEYIDIEDATDKVILTIYYNTDKDNKRKVETYELPKLDIDPQDYLYKIHSYNNSSLTKSEIVDNNGFSTDGYYYIVNLPPIIDENDSLEISKQVPKNNVLYWSISRIIFILGCILEVVMTSALISELDSNSISEIKSNIDSIMEKINSGKYGGISKEELEQLNKKYNNLNNKYKLLKENLEKNRIKGMLLRIKGNKKRGEE